MACITKQTMIRLFDGYRNLKPSEAIDFNACCTNSIQDIENNFSKSLNRSEFNIGSIGRLDKPFILNLIRDIQIFANHNPDLQIQMVFFGGASTKVEEKIKRELAKCKNIKTVISGYMWPFPKSALESMDVFASAAGSKNLSYSLGYRQSRWMFLVEELLVLWEKRRLTTAPYIGKHQIEIPRKHSFILKRFFKETLTLRIRI